MPETPKTPRERFLDYLTDFENFLKAEWENQYHAVLSEFAKENAIKLYDAQRELIKSLELQIETLEKELNRIEPRLM